MPVIRMMTISRSPSKSASPVASVAQTPMAVACASGPAHGQALHRNESARLQRGRHVGRRNRGATEGGDRFHPTFHAKVPAGLPCRLRQA